jgi:hypothetical protein
MKKEVAVKTTNISGKVIDGCILGLVAFMGTKGFQLGCRTFEDIVPSAVEKVHMAGIVADMTKEISKENKKKKKKQKKGV